MDAQEKYNSVFPSRLRTLLEERGITITALAKELKISRQAVSQYVDGSAQPNIDRLVMIARFFDVSSDYLLGLSDYKQNQTGNLTAKEMGISESAALQLCKDTKNNGFSGMLLSMLAKSSCFYDLANAVASYIHVITLANERTDTIPRVYKLEKMAKYRRYLVNESFFKVLDSSFILFPLDERIAIARTQEKMSLSQKKGDSSHAVDQKKDK